VVVVDEADSMVMYVVKKKTPNCKKLMTDDFGGSRCTLFATTSPPNGSRSHIEGWGGFVVASSLPILARVAINGTMVGKFWMNYYFRSHLCRDYVAVVLKGSIEKTVGRTLLRVEKSA